MKGICLIDLSIFLKIKNMNKKMNRDTVIEKHCQNTKMRVLEGVFSLLS
jgi:hypothetical protein